MAIKVLSNLCTKIVLENEMTNVLEMPKKVLEFGYPFTINHFYFPIEELGNRY